MAYCFLIVIITEKTMSILTSESAPPIPIPNILPVEEYGIDPSIAYSAACTDVVRAARQLPQHPTLALAELLVSTEVGIARVRKDKQQTQGSSTAAFDRKTDFLEQYPGMFITERGINDDEIDLAITLACGAIYALRAQSDTPFDIRGFLEQNYALEQSART